jgi:hypothetical protein
VEVWREEVTELLRAQDVAVWNRLVQSHKAFAFATTEFLTGNVDRVAVLRVALRGYDKNTAIYMLKSLRQSELQEIFTDLVFHASYAHGAIEAVRDAILSLPRNWVVSRIEEVAEPLIADGTYDEYRRLLELYTLLDPELTQRLAEQAVRHADPDIQEAGNDFLSARMT